jgi:hypothetical protein
VTVDVVDSVAERSSWRVAAVPSEHGGWGLTLEPVLLGLLIAPSVAGAALGVSALFAFLVRTPLKLAVVDVRRGRWLERSQLAVRIAVGELVVLVGAAAAAVWASGWSWLVPVALAVPFVGVEAWFDFRSRARRFVPELCGAIGIGAVAAAIVLAADRGAALAVGVWLILAGRSVAAIPFVRVQIVRLRRGAASIGRSDAAQSVAMVIGGVAVGVDQRLFAGLAGLIVLAVLHAVWVRRPMVAAKVLGLRQMALGIVLVIVTAAGVLVS